MKFIEHDEQVALMRRAALTRFNGGHVRDWLFAIPNGGTGGGRRAMIAALRRKAEGLTAGVPDVFCFLPRKGFAGLFVEMKKPKGVPSDVTDDQRTMMKRMTEAGYLCVVGFGCDQAWEFITEYLGIKQ